jgi:hypothetical protein
MATSMITISGTSWTPITNAGQKGTVWLNDIASSGEIFIDHSILTNGTDCDRNKSFKLQKAWKNNQVVILTPDSGTDIYYASNDTATESYNIVVDVI